MSKPFILNFRQTELGQVCYEASYRICFASDSWRYTTADAGKYYWMREFFRRLGPVMIAYSYAVHDPVVAATGDKLQDDVALRGSLLELDRKS